MSRRYVLLTAAKDEEACIGEVIGLVLQQTVLPVAWHIVDDGSTDRTAEIVRHHARAHPFIRLHGSGSRGGRNFGSQYKAIQAAYAIARQDDFDCVAVQDADQAPAQAHYYESILGAFEADASLGMASGMVWEREGGGAWRRRRSNSAGSTAGSAVFRRACFETIGGYKPLEYGGSDWLAQVEARMAGWSVSTLDELRLLHYRPSSSAGGLWRGRLREGMEDASFGTHPAFEVVKCGRRLLSRPLVLGAAIRFMGYLSWHLARRPPVLPADRVEFIRSEQLDRLWSSFPRWRVGRSNR